MEWETKRTTKTFILQKSTLSRQKVFGDLRNKLDSFSKFRDGWNGPGSKAIEPSTIERAERLLMDILAALPNEDLKRIEYLAVCPTNEGGIGFETGTAEKEVEIEMFPDSPLLGILKEFLSTSEMIEEQIDETRIQQIIGWLLE